MKTKLKRILLTVLPLAGLLVAPQIGSFSCRGSADHHHAHATLLFL